MSISKASSYEMAQKYHSIQERLLRASDRFSDGYDEALHCVFESPNGELCLLAALISVAPWRKHDFPILLSLRSGALHVKCQQPGGPPNMDRLTLNNPLRIIMQHTPYVLMADPSGSVAELLITCYAMPNRFGTVSLDAFIGSATAPVSAPLISAPV